GEEGCARGHRDGHVVEVERGDESREATSDRRGRGGGGWHGRRLFLLNGFRDVNGKVPAEGAPAEPPLADAPRRRYDARPMDETATARVTGVAQVFDLHALKAFAP